MSTSLLLTGLKSPDDVALPNGGEHQKITYRALKSESKSKDLKIHDIVDLHVLLISP